LRDSEGFDFTAKAGWARAYFWTWFALRLGYGDMREDLLSLRDEWPEEFWEAWNASISQADDVLVGEFMDYMNQCSLPEIGSRVDESLYRRWLELSGLHWDFFERWMKQRI
jgi:hypothetical protein